MNKGELKTAFLADTKRPDLSGEADRFVRLAEGLIARTLPNYAQDATLTLDDDDRDDTSSDLYALPVGVVEVRRVELAAEDTERGYPLDPLGPNALALKLRSARPAFYALLGNRLQVRGVPAEGAELRVLIWGRLAALEEDEDTNAILTAHEGLYMHACSFYVYRHTQDRELAQDELELFTTAAEALNEEARRLIGNAGAAELYDFGGGGGY